MTASGTLGIPGAYQPQDYAVGMIRTMSQIWKARPLCVQKAFCRYVQIPNPNGPNDCAGI